MKVLNEIVDEEIELELFLDWYCPEPNFLNYREWCFPVDFANGIFA